MTMSVPPANDASPSSLQQASVFVSSQAVDRMPAQGLLAALRNANIQVEHSPSNPLDGQDVRWSDWYGVGLIHSLRRSNVFVIAVDQGWESSTWMAQEADMALHSPLVAPQLQAFFWNPMRVEVRAAGMVGYLRAELPVDVMGAVEILTQAASRRTRG
jgi:hypothetical protein